MPRSEHKCFASSLVEGFQNLGDPNSKCNTLRCHVAQRSIGLVIYRRQSGQVSNDV